MDDIYFPPLARYRFCLRALTPIKLPPYTGSTWRGLLATALRQSVCVSGLKRCEPCLVKDFCAFFRLFEQPVLGDDPDPRYRNSSPPFVLDSLGDGGRIVQPMEPIEIGLNLIGDSIDLLPFWVYAFQRAGTLGIGRDHGRFDLIEVMQEPLLGSDRWETVWRNDTPNLIRLDPQPAAFPAPPKLLDLLLLTPLRIKRRGDWVTASDFSAAEFLRHLCVRLDRLEQQYGQTSDSAFWTRHRQQIEALPSAAQDVHWYDWTRYSSRQQQRMNLGGLVGRFRVPDAALPELWPVIWLGQWVHLGKNTSFGLGAYRAMSGL